MERLKRMSVFAKVVELGSFTAAARQLQMSVSSISQTVAKLEDELAGKAAQPQHPQPWLN
ncbi:LysR family transcriptional regulator [Klebsiella variicola subsp. variicola]|nr:LysR family transcriptional regulator [Klebsiella variicola subsp. variicola]